MITASEIYRHVQCTGYKFLEKIHTFSSKAQEGTEVHALIEHYIKTGENKDPENKKLTSFVNFWSALNADHAVNVLAVEQAYGYDMLSGVSSALEVKSREYPNEDGYIYGTADLVCEIDGVKTVIDWKTGQKRSEYIYQLAMLRILSGAESAVIVYLSDDGHEYVEFNQEELDHAENMIVDRIICSGRIVFERTPMCLDCPALGCPFTLSVKNMEVGSVLSSEDAYYALMKKKQLEEEVDRIDAEVKRYCDSIGGVVDLMDGSLYVARQEERKTLDTKKVSEYLSKSGVDLAQFEKTSSFKKYVRVKK